LVAQAILADVELDDGGGVDVNWRERLALRAVFVPNSSGALVVPSSISARSALASTWLVVKAP
jgi:hypothetical protein